MAYRLTYTSTRPDTSEDWYFFKEGADAGFETNSTHFRNWLDARSDVTVTLTVAEDNLSFKWELDFADEDEVETVGGLVFSKINRIPKSNEEFNIDDIVNIKVLRASERKILTVQIRKIVN